MIKLISSFIFGLMLVLPLDFLIFIGLKIHYFDFYKIDEYFNIYFWDAQSFLLIFSLCFVLGFFVLYSPIRKFVRIFYLTILIACFVSLFKPISRNIGLVMFSKKALNCKLGKQQFQADLLYEGRKNYYLKREGIKKTIKIPKKNLLFL